MRGDPSVEGIRASEGMIRKDGCERGWQPRPRRLGFDIKG
jgi:hypothetical protein